MAFLMLIAQDNESELIKDIDGNVYHTVKIGNQIWLKENLKTMHFRNGDKIETTNPASLNISEGTENGILTPEILKRSASIKPNYQWAYNGDEANVSTYGRLYTWEAANDKRGLCPEGWRIPTAGEWSTLIKYLGGDVVAGGKLKSANDSLWMKPNIGATNESGFTALPAGGKYPDGSFGNMGKFTAWWTTTPSMYKHIEYDEPYTFGNYYYVSKYWGFSVRCIKDK